MLKILLVTTAVAALAISSTSWAQERAPGGAGAEPAMNNPEGSKEAPAAKAPNEKMRSPARDEKTKSGEGEKASQPAMRADEQKTDSNKRDSTEKGGKAEDNHMKAQPGAASRSNSENTNMQERRGSQESQAPQQRGQRATSTESGEKGAGQISSEQRSKLRTGFKGVQIREASGVDITNVRVGSNITRAVSEYWAPVPVAILDIVPDWRDYRVVRIHDEIVIIDPETFEIIYVF